MIFQFFRASKYFILLLFCVISIFGIINIYSGSNTIHGIIGTYAQKQSIFFIFAILLVFLVSKFGIKIFYRYAYFGLALVFILLILLRFFGSGRGTMRWLKIGFINIQPSEIAKIAIVIALAKYFYDIKCRPTIVKLILPIALTCALFFVILIQPDLGTALILAFSAGSIFVFAGVSRGFFISVFLGLTGAIPLMWSMLKSYQKDRILTLFYENDPLGTGYQITQSKIAIGSGGLFGKGMMHGTQSLLNFLPEKRTDFIFALMSEEWGFVGAVTLIFCYIMIVFIAMFLALKQKHVFHRTIIIGAASLLFIHVFINIGMVCGLLPVVGVPLPFMSYGGSSMLLFSVCIGIIVSENETKKFTD